MHLIIVIVLAFIVTCFIAIIQDEPERVIYRPPPDPEPPRWPDDYSSGPLDWSANRGKTYPHSNIKDAPHGRYR